VPRFPASSNTTPAGVGASSREVDRAEAASLTALATGIYRACLQDLVAHGMQVQGLAIRAQLWQPDLDQSRGGPALTGHPTGTACEAISLPDLLLWTVRVLTVQRSRSGGMDRQDRDEIRDRDEDGRLLTVHGMPQL